MRVFGQIFYDILNHNTCYLSLKIIFEAQNIKHETNKIRCAIIIMVAFTALGEILLITKMQGHQHIRTASCLRKWNN